jgi:hypothetical protein
VKISGGYIVDAIAASGFEKRTRLGGDHTFTRNLIIQLKNSWQEPSSVSWIYGNLVDQIKAWRPIGQREDRATPVHFPLVVNRRDTPRAIVLEKLLERSGSSPDEDLDEVSQKDSDSWSDWATELGEIEEDLILATEETMHNLAGGDDSSSDRR